MPRRSWKIPFAVAGDTSSIPTAAQSDGSVSIQQGYGPDYERPTDGTDPLGKVFPRTPFNGLANEITASIGEIQQYGFAMWADDMAPYPVSAWVRHAGKVWQNTIDSNSAAPDAPNSGWTSSGGSASGGNKVRITASSTFVVPDGVTTIYVSGSGGGGGGGAGATQGSNNAAGGGGGGGSGRTVIYEAYTVAGGQSLPVVIGAGGAGGALSFNGTAGGATSLGSLLSLAGGTGGQRGASGDFGSGGVAGSPGGQWGGDGVYDMGGNGGQGGSNPFGTAGGGARARRGNGGGVAITVAAGYGAGGGGGGAGYDPVGNTGIGMPGGAGMPGVLFIEW